VEDLVGLTFDLRNWGAGKAQRNTTYMALRRSAARSWAIYTGRTGGITPPTYFFAFFRSARRFFIICEISGREKRRTMPLVIPRAAPVAFLVWGNGYRRRENPDTLPVAVYRAVNGPKTRAGAVNEIFRKTR
jgi:hypothetical protein